ncbi:DUF4440 domain-containing protein [Ectobacillus sp. sgz5001026]|uniref:nuclear transport factor 2 family protein n=1 Tax=Ectobacillus sp. sgz5001026 TaxID=3242473 RepID=UPI0036D31D54
MNYDELKQIIYHLECSHLKPNVRVSAEKLSTILADDYFEFGTSGHIWRRSDYAGDHPLSPDRFVISNFDIHLLAPDCVLTTYHILNETKAVSTLRSSIWRNSNGTWKLFFHQGTKTNEPPFTNH